MTPVVEMLLAVLQVCTEEELGDEDSDIHDTADIGATPTEIANRREAIKAKIRTIGRMQRVFSLLRCVREIQSDGFPNTLQRGDGERSRACCQWWGGDAWHGRTSDFGRLWQPDSTIHSQLRRCVCPFV
jgi:hypothetical protein